MERAYPNKKESIVKKLRNVFLGLTTSLLILTGCEVATPLPSQAKNTTPVAGSTIEAVSNKPYTISPELISALTPKDLDNIDKAFNLQQEMYGCKTKIKFLGKDLSYKTIKDKDFNYYFPEEAIPGSIWLDMNLINKVNELRDKRFYNIILHALQHSCDPQEISKPKKRLILSNGNEVVGFQGYSIQLIKPNGQIEWFHLFEEASAEYKSIRADPNEYMPQSIDYMELEAIFNSLALTYSDLGFINRWDQTSDVMGFVGQVVGKNNPDVKDLEFLIDAFNKVKNKEPIVPILHNIYNRREKLGTP